MYYLGTFDNGNATQQAVYSSRHRRNSSENVADAERAFRHYYGGHWALINSTFLSSDKQEAVEMMDDTVQWIMIGE